jgi:hypothetical protein
MNYLISINKKSGKQELKFKNYKNIMEVNKLGSSLI